MSLGGPSHRLVAAFFEAGLLAVLAIALLPALLAVPGTAWPAARALPSALGWTTTPFGLFAGGIVAGTALERGRRGTLAVGGAFLAAGLVLSWPLATLQHLTGFEPLAVVAPFALVSFAVAFGLSGVLLVAALALPRAGWVRTGWGMAGGGATGALLLILPLVLRAAGADLDGAAGFVGLACQAFSVLAPFLSAALVLGASAADLRSPGDR